MSWRSVIWPGPCPYTSHADVHFSAGATVSPPDPVPHIRPRPRERYYVFGPQLEPEFIGETRSATEALSLVLQHLQPAGPGAA
ncbi:DUF6193 family natural product biosynthesis protein [Dactylosporangium sp. NPDC000521]|uniref:DUF6193 family natural product biosynthesis protein n=1 Tax=Dactylosporangium sp. NPDC000521 TaxID=3363975 RepID=UPI0036CCF841